MRKQPKKRIILGVHSLQAGGTERVVSLLAQQFALRKDLEVHVLMYGRSPKLFYDLPNTVSVHCPGFEFDAHSRLIGLCRSMRFVRTTIKELQPEFVLNFGEYWNNLILLATLGLGVPVIVADRSSPTKPLAGPHENLRKLLYRRAAAVVVQTEEAAGILRTKLGQYTPIHVLPNPLFTMPPIATFARALEVLFVGRLIPSKHVDRLIRAFAVARAAGWRLVIVGGDAQGFSEMKTLRELVGRLGLESCVDLVGTQKDVARFFSRAAVFAFPSSSEGFPNALAEALSFGLPGVAYDCSAGPADLIRDGENGFLVPVFDDGAFAARLSLLMKDAALRERMSAAAVQSVQGLEKSRIADQVLDFCLNATVDGPATASKARANEAHPD